ncbi:hypothetical protein M409DRAFT_64347 [Zasmidium cellare ATCC 36951]|uniref:NmrA-like domain-containing protein n=1 Tax=Zasmidium cellare ATCC 36951 TaxID=1080233 RepID=A0A6A6CVV1_ZASCE|nr:uncharacterized protein M409DRAFT_64347 [Zasmidium cellare ATCC 36951]KAF2169919.1 hypothetical protein M409DRAFT_64347 [Zasmidium cellare ATCC 36951]
MATRTIVFGPTGNVGSIVACTAQRHGAKVFLAMRDTSKSIPGLSAIEETSGGFERVTADLTNPESVSAAVKRTRATSAFMYLAHQSRDHMRATLHASKDSGIRFIVFLSSFTINRPLEDIPSNERIPWIHAQVEKNLEEIYGPKNYVALRAGAFATNTLRWRDGLQAGEVFLTSPDTKFDFITDVDMGRVGGTILAQGQRDTQNIVYLYGPKLVTQRYAIVTVAKALGREVVWGDEEDGSGKAVRVRLGGEETRGSWWGKAYDNHDEGASNVVKYTGEAGTGFGEWVEENVERYKA